MDAIEKKKQIAIKFLVDIGLLIPAKNVKLYHGRVKEDGEKGEWGVNPDFNNGGNKTGNRNLNAIASLSTGEYELAKEFAQARWKYNYGSKGTPEVHRIVTGDNDLIFNRLFEVSKLTPKEKTIMEDALRVLAGPSLSKVAPVDFEYREVAQIVYDKLMQYRAKKGIDGFFPKSEIVAIAKELNRQNPKIDLEIVTHIAGALNAKLAFIKNPREILSKFIFDDGNKRNNLYILKEDKNGYILCPLNMDYVASLVSDSNIVGVRSLAESATVGHKIDAYYMFDLHRIQTKKQEGDKIRQIMDDYLEFSLLINNFDLEENNVLPPLKTASPEEIMDSLTTDPEFGHLFKAPAGVWEGFSIGEHTETVLRVFDNNFADEIPSELIPIMKLSLICHDIGKGMPSQNGESVMKRNLDYSHKFLQQFNLPREVEAIIRFIIGPSQTYTSNYYVKKDKNAEHDLYVKCAELLTRLYGISPSDEQIKGLMGMCKILQTCDSGAYTRYAVTRDKNTGIYYKNGNDRFTESFETPTDISKKHLRLKDPKSM